MLDLIIYFFIYAFLGCLLKTAYLSIRMRKLVIGMELGFLPLCPAFGFGGIAFVMCLLRFWENPLLLFAGGFFIGSCVEYLYSYVFERFFGIALWNYEKKAGNIFGKICAVNSFLWGILAIVFFKLIHPAVALLVLQMNGYYKILLATVFLSILISDGSETVKRLKGTTA